MKAKEKQQQKKHDPKNADGTAPSTTEKKVDGKKDGDGSSSEDEKPNDGEKKKNVGTVEAKKDA